MEMGLRKLVTFNDGLRYSPCSIRKIENDMGQKGTIGITLRNSDMMFSESGVQPDIIMNPAAIPSQHSAHVNQ